RRRAACAGGGCEAEQVRNHARRRRASIGTFARGRRCLRALGTRTRTLMSTIRALPDHLINQVAAGKVVERPAAALKELLENSIDAGARSVDIDLAGGGIKLIRVADDGAGIAREALTLAVASHATYKIATPADNEAIATLVFRGAAPTPIAAVQ